MSIQHIITLILCISTVTVNGKFLTNMTYSGYTEDIQKTGFTLSGKVLDEDTGEAIRFASLAIYKNGRLIQGVESGQDGKYSINNLPRGEYSIEPSYIGYQPKRIEDIVVNQDLLGYDIKIKEGKILEPYFMNCNTVVLSNLSEIKPKKKEHYTISGKVLDEVTGEPVLFARIVLYKDDVIYKETETSLEGNYVIYNIVSGEYSLEPSFAGYQSKKIDDIVVNQDLLAYDIKIKGLEPSNKECICKESTVTYYSEPIVEEAFRLSGQVLNKDTKEPIMLASVALYTKEGILLAGAETDLEGRYIFNNITKEEYHIEASFIGYQPVRISGFLVDKDITNADISLTEGLPVECYIIYCGDFEKPLIKQDDTTSGMTLMSYDIRPTYSLHYSRPSKTKKKRIKKKERKKKKDNLEEETTIAPKKIAVQELEVKKEAIDIHMYPNPTSGQVYIKASTEIEKVDVLNIAGKVIISIPYDKDSGIDLTQLSAATYFLGFHHKNGVQVEKLVVLDPQ